MADRERPLREEQLSTLVQAVGAAAAGGVPLEVTLGALAEEREDPRLARIARRLAAELERGVPISEAVAGMERQLPMEVSGLLRAGVECGDLAGTFERFAHQRLAAQRIGRRIRGALAYPLLIAAILTPLMLMISVYVIPMFRDIFEDFALDLPAITLVVLGSSEQVPELVGGLLIFMVAVPLLMRLVGGRWLFHRVRAATPLVGSLWLWSSQREFAALLASFLDLRLPMSNAVRHTGQVISDRNMSRACLRVSDRLTSGESLSQCLNQSIHFDRSLVALVAWGESQGLLPEALRISTEVFDDRIEQHATLIHRLLPPVTLIGVGAVMGFVVIALMIPLVKLIEGLAK